MAYAVTSFGGLLGMGESYQPLPWKVLTCGTAQGGYVVDLSREQLHGARGYTGNSLPVWTDWAYGCRINDRYGAPLGM